MTMVPRPENLAREYELQQTLARERGTIDGWRVCCAGPEAPFACAPLPLSTKRPGPSHVFAAEPVPLLPVLYLRIGRNLPRYDAPFGAGEAVQAIESSHAGLLILKPPVSGGVPVDALVSVATNCRQTGLVYGPGVAGLTGTAMAPLTISTGRGRRQERSITHSAAVPDATEALLPLVNVWARWVDGLAIGHTVAFVLPGDEIEAAPGTWVRVSLGMLGILEVRVESTRG